jgi:hypothetical protein
MDIRAICGQLGITTKDIENGVEVYVNKKLVYSILRHTATTTRIIYPKGSEHTHTTMWDCPFSENIVLQKLLVLAINLLQKERENVNGIF